MEPTTPKNCRGRPKKCKSFRGSTPKQEIIPKSILDTKNIDAEQSPCIQNFPQEIPSSVVSVTANVLNVANTRIPFLLIFCSVSEFQMWKSSKKMFRSKQIYPPPKNVFFLLFWAKNVIFGHIC